MILLDNWAAILGSISSISMFYRMNVSMEIELSEQEEIVKDPLAYAVRTTVTFSEFQTPSWKAFDALMKATRFRTFHRRVRWLVDPFISKICAMFLIGAFISLIVIAQIIMDDPKINNDIGGAIVVIITFWWAIVDRCRALKKSVEKIRIA